MTITKVEDLFSKEKEWICKKAIAHYTPGDSASAAMLFVIILAFKAEGITFPIEKYFNEVNVSDN